MSVETKHVKIVVGEARLSYTQNVFKPRASESGGEPKYSVVAIIPKTNTVLVNKIKAGIKEAAQKGIDILGGKIPVNLKSPLRDGDNDPPGGNPRPELMGMFYITSSTLDQPLVVDRNRQVIINPTELYSGCYGFVSMNLKAYSHKTGGKGIGAYLNGVQKSRDGEPLGFVKESAEEMFEELEPASDSGSLLD